MTLMRTTKATIPTKQDNQTGSLNRISIGSINPLLCEDKSPTSSRSYDDTRTSSSRYHHDNNNNLNQKYLTKAARRSFLNQEYKTGIMDKATNMDKKRKNKNKIRSDGTKAARLINKSILIDNFLFSTSLTPTIIIASLLLSLLFLNSSQSTMALSLASKALDGQMYDSELSPNQESDLRDKALASAIISRIMLDNLTNACADGTTNCLTGNSASARNEQLAEQQAISEARLRFLLDQLESLNNQQQQHGSSQTSQSGELLFSYPMLPNDQNMESIKRASARLHSKSRQSGNNQQSDSGSTDSASGSGSSWTGTHAHELSIGALKRPDSTSILLSDGGPTYIKRPASSNRQYEFGLGKRVANPSYSRYDFGLGKRASSSSMNEYRYDFGLGRK